MFFFSGQSYRKVAVLLENVACLSAEHDYCLKDKRAFEVHWKVIYLLWLLDLKIRGRRRRKRQLKSEFAFMQSALRGGHVGLRYCGIEYFSSGISLILILMCGIAVSSSPPVCCISSFWVTVFGKRRSFKVFRCCSFSLSCLKPVNVC